MNPTKQREHNKAMQTAFKDYQEDLTKAWDTYSEKQTKLINKYFNR